MISWDSIVMLAVVHALGCAAAYCIGWLNGNAVGFRNALGARPRSRLSRQQSGLPQ